MSTRKKLIVIIGPTASGKSELAAKFAKKVGGETIAADSRQIYKGLDIGTAKVKGQWCTDIADTKKTTTVVEWKRCAEDAIDTIYRIGKTPIIVGGTMFYIKALADGLIFSQVPPNPKLRKKIEKKNATEIF